MRTETRIGTTDERRIEWRSPIRARRRIPRWVPVICGILLTLLVVTFVSQSASNFFSRRTIAARIDAADRPSAASFSLRLGQTLEQSLASAQQKNPAQAVDQLNAAIVMIQDARTAQMQLPPDLFAETSGQLDRIHAELQDPQSAAVVQNARVELATLRSGIETFAPPARTVPWTETFRLSANSEFKPNSTARLALQLNANYRLVAENTQKPQADSAGLLLDGTSLGEAEFFAPPSSRLYVENVRVEDVALQNGTQTLDGIHWTNVAFVGTSIRFTGGSLELRNARFIHCSFDFAPGDRSSRLADAIARGTVSLVLY
ncbi:MAG: hypothetical protein ACRD50_16655 [Candidatus Acidiferrales bacterium]